MSQRGEHTWDLFLEYHRCPECGFINESQESYTYHFGKYEKEIACDRCQEIFCVYKKSEPRFGPLLGEPEPVEFTW